MGYWQNLVSEWQLAHNLQVFPTRIHYMLYYYMIKNCIYYYKKPTSKLLTTFFLQLLHFK